jgi:hypothetical protein
MNFFGLKHKPATAVLPPGWQILMDGNTTIYYNAERDITQREFPQPEPAHEPERELPAGWKKVIFNNESNTWVTYESTVVPGVSQSEFPTAPSRALNPLWEEFKVGNTTMYRSKSNKTIVRPDFQDAFPHQITEMWKQYNGHNQQGQWRGGKRKQSKRKQSKRKQSKRNQRKKSH